MDMWMDVDTALAEVPVNLMPLLDDTDFKTRETAIAYNAAGMDLVWNFVTTAGAYTQTAVTPTTAGTYDWTHQGDGMYSIEIPASGGASINNDTEGFGWFSGLATGVLPWRGPVIGFRAAALNDALIDGGDNLDVNTVQFNGTNATASGGRPEVNTTHAAGTAWESGAITAASIAADAITAAKIADGSIDAATFAAGAINAAAIASDAITAAKIADGAIDAATFAAGAINAAAIASDAITDAKVASDVTIASVTGAVGSVIGNVGGNVVGSVASVTARVTANTDQLAGQTVTAAAGVTFPASVASPTNITAGTITTATNVTTVNGLAANVITAASTAADFVTEVQNGIATAANLATAQTSLNTIAADTAAILLDTGTDGVVVAAASKTGFRLSATGVDDILDEVVLGSYTMRQLLRGISAATLGELSGAATTTITIRSADDTKDVVIATVDANGNRSAVTLDLT